MAWTLVDSGTAGFADGNAGHVVSLNNAPQAGDLDVIVANSDTVVSTPSGFTSAVSAVSNQGAYIFYRFAAGGESSSVTVTTSGNFNAVVGWSRWRGGQAKDVHASVQINSSVGGATPAVDTGTLAATGELVIAAACLHRLASPEPADPVWSSGYTALTSVTQGTSNAGCVQYVAYKTNAGTAAETPSATWTNGAFDRYILVVTFTPSPGAVIDLGRATESDTGRALTAAKTGTLSRAAETDTGRPLAASKTLAPARASETDAGRALVLSKTFTLAPASDTETARPLAVGKTVPLGRATETDTAGTLVTGQATPLGQASETSTARTLTLAKTVTLGRASETALAQPLAAARLVSLGRAVETLTARPAALAKTLPLTRATETATAHALTVSGGTAPATLDHLGGALLDTGLLGGTLL